MLKFKNLWKNYPDERRMKFACVNKQPTSSKPFGNYCAIILSEALIKPGVSMNNFKGNKCWSHSGMRHALLAEDLATWLKAHNLIGVGKTERVAPASFQSNLKGRTGIIFFKDYWQRGNESFGNRSGDHIDLWNKSSITSGSMFYRSIIESFGFVSDLNKSKEILFWGIDEK
ncbi:MAG: hypothetical protein GY820_02550 [Gammaproteobacteria bacterium]|nr:hypothetical protein [Gammaproteobacteria bacterium]